MATTIRSLREDHTGSPVFLHYKTNGSVDMRFWIGAQAYFLPISLILKALVETNDREIYEKVVFGNNFHTSIDVTEEVQTMLQQGKYKVNSLAETLNTQQQCLDYIGKEFKALFSKEGKHQDISNVEAAHVVFKQYMLVHLDSLQDKFECLMYGHFITVNFVDTCYRNCTLWQRTKSNRKVWTR